MKQKWLVALIINIVALHITPSLYAQQENNNTSDGPYVLYENDSIVIKSIVVNGGIQKAVSQHYSLSEKKNIVLQIRFSEHRNWAFDVKLQPSLDNEKVVWDQPVKLLALSDIEGEFEAFRNLLIANKVMDKKYNWIFGNGQVVICGDLFDRGKNVAEELWLLYKLEQDAKTKGGYLHTILGNHDIMNLSGDVRYVQPKYFNNAVLMGTEYLELYKANTELGRWLRTKNIVEKIGTNLCMHAGFSSALNDLHLPLAEINNICRPYYDKGTREATFDNQNVGPFFSDNSSPFWYRGYFITPKAKQSQVDSTLNLYECSKIIVGHTIVETNVGSYYENKVIGVDVNQHNGRHEAVLFENGQWFKVNTTGKKYPLLQVQ